MVEGDLLGEIRQRKNKNENMILELGESCETSRYKCAKVDFWILQWNTRDLQFWERYQQFNTYTINTQYIYWYKEIEFNHSN